MRLDLDLWSASSTAVELIPCRRVRPTAAYFRAGHLLLDVLTRWLRQHLSPADARAQPASHLPRQLQHSSSRTARPPPAPRARGDDAPGTK